MLLTLKAACEAICARALASLAGLLPGAAASTLQTIAIGLLAIDALELAVMFRQPIEALTGRSLLPVLTGTAQQTHPADEAIGHELSGNQALFKGDLKPVLNLPPVGDGQWPRHNLRTDPGETQDLRQRMPEVFQLMRSDYEAWARAHGVLPVPAGTSPARQVMINSYYIYWLPTDRYHALALLSGLLALVAIAVLMRRRRRSR